jgi:SUMO ligase MMS21 Smc5/6 complex component
MTKVSKKSQTKQSCKTGVSGSTIKLMFFYDVFKKKRDIETQIFNDVFCEYEEKFHLKNNYKTAMADFKKYLKLAAENKGYEITIHNATQFNAVHGLRTVWSVKYYH